MDARTLTLTLEAESEQDSKAMLEALRAAFKDKGEVELRIKKPGEPAAEASQPRRPIRLRLSGGGIRSATLYADVLSSLGKLDLSGDAVLTVLSFSVTETKWIAPTQPGVRLWWQRVARYNLFAPFIMLASIAGFLVFHLSGVAPAWAGFAAGYAGSLFLTSFWVALRGS